ncbi:nudix domain-containing protein [Xylariaceae sp. FL0594]|nr:nudix domain-containing protein [Xylariaceae sp. FL0594]
MAATTANPRVGVAALICETDTAGGAGSQIKLLMGKRAGSHGAGSLAFPGGHLEMGESFFACAERETMEETGLKVKADRVVAVTNDVFDPAARHYITIFVLCVREDPAAKARNMEPHKCEGWAWMSWDEIRECCEHHDDTSSPMWAGRKCFLPIRNLVREHPQLDLAVSLPR